MAPKFGTSGLRGLVTELTEDLVTDYTRAFATACPMGECVCVGWDLRASSPDIAEVVVTALLDQGIKTLVAGAVPTPALALGAATRGMAAIMITGSHIPADRNGLKFYTPSGEIGKTDEAAIEGARGAEARNLTADKGELDLNEEYRQRYVRAYGVDALSGLRVGVYQHSSVARDIIMKVIGDLGGTAVPLGRSDIFIPVDTEAVDPETRRQLTSWCKDNALDALISTDGDADRPMVTDANGQIVPGDLLGPLTAQALEAELIVTPVSSNTAVDEMGFGRVVRTRIGSPFVIAGMEANAGKVVGYEANGGFLLGFEAEGPAGPLPALMTRDCLLPILAPLSLAASRRLSLAQLVANLPQRFTSADRLQGVATEASQAFLQSLSDDADARAAFFASVASTLGSERAIDRTDGLRVSFDGAIVHLRPSGNAPEFRCYAEASSKDQASELVDKTMGRLADHLKTT